MMVTFCLANVTTGFKLLDVAASTPPPSVILGQEVRIEGRLVPSLARSLSRDYSYNAQINPARVTEAGGLSGGVAIAALPPYQLLNLPSLDGCATPAPDEDRVCFRIFDGLLRYGTLNVSAYFHTGCDFTGPTTLYLML